MTVSPWSDARHVLAVRLDAMGDLLMTGPALRAMAADGTREVSLLTSPAGAAVAPLLPGVGDVVVYEAPWMKATPPRSGPAEELELVEGLRCRSFDAAVIFTAATQTPHPAAMLCWLAGIPLRLAHEGAGKTYQLLTDQASAAGAPDEEHEVARQLRLVRQVGWTTADERLRVAVPPHAGHRVSVLLAQRGVDEDRPWAVLHPGATAPSRRYPAAAYGRAIDLLTTGGWQIVVVATEEERSLAEVAAAGGRGDRVHLLVGQLGVAELAALIDRASLFIGNNSGPSHLATAVGTPVVSLYALTNLDHRPWRIPARVLSEDVPCRNCQRSVCPLGHHRCLRGVRPEAVSRAATELLADTAERRALASP